MRPWIVNKEISYKRWIADRVKEVKLPFELISHDPDGKCIPDASCEQIERLKEELERLKKKNIALNDICKVFDKTIQTLRWSVN